MEWITEIHQPTFSIHYYCKFSVENNFVSQCHLPIHSTRRLPRAAPSWTCQVRIQAPVSMSFWTTVPSLLPGKHAGWQRNFMVFLKGSTQWEEFQNGTTNGYIILFFIYNSLNQTCPTSIAGVKNFWTKFKLSNFCSSSPRPAWKGKATSKATREDRTRLTSRIKMEWMFEARKNWGHGIRMFGNCNSKLFQNLEIKKQMGQGYFNKY